MENVMKLLGNILWFVFGGFELGLAWWLVGCICYLTILGIPWGKACFVIGNFTFFPFGNEAVNRRDINGEHDIGTGIAGTIGNIIWFVFAGVWLALGHAFAALICCVTIIGIPFGLQHFKLAKIALSPIGKTIIPKATASNLK